MVGQQSHLSNADGCCRRGTFGHHRSRAMWFGEDPLIDRLIGNSGIERHLKSCKWSSKILATAETFGAAHLIHGSSEDRFRVIYCPGAMSREQIESVDTSMATWTKRRGVTCERSKATDGKRRTMESDSTLFVIRGLDFGCMPAILCSGAAVSRLA